MQSFDDWFASQELNGMIGHSYAGFTLREWLGAAYSAGKVAGEAKAKREGQEGVYITAAGALAGGPGPKTLFCPFVEAFKLAGLETRDLQGRRAWYCTPIALESGQSRTQPEAWGVAVSTDYEANERSIAEVKRLLYLP